VRRLILLPEMFFLTVCLAVPDARAAALGLWDCVGLAVKNHPLAVSGDWRVKDAAGAVDESGVAFKPEFRFNGSYSAGSYVPEVSFPGRSMLIGDHDDLTLSVQADYLLYDWGRRDAAREAERSQLDAAGRALGAIRQDLAFRAGAAFLALQGARSEREAAAVSVSTAESHLNDLRALYGAGRLYYDEVLNGEVRLEQARVRLNRSGYQVELSRAELLQCLGFQPDDPAEFADMAEGAPVPPSDGYALEKALSARPDLAVYNVRAEALDHRSSAIGAIDKPMVSLFVSGVAAQPGVDQFRNEFIQYARAGVAVNWEFWDWRRKDFSLARNESQKQALLAEGRDLAVRIGTELERARLQEKEASDRLTLTLKTLEAAEEHFRLIGTRFSQGVATNTEYLDSEAQLTTSRLERIQARIALEQARWRLAWVSGSLSREINARWPETDVRTGRDAGMKEMDQQSKGEAR